MTAGLFDKEYYATLNASQIVVDDNVKRSDDYPGGSVRIEETYTSGYQVKGDAGLDFVILEAAIGVTLNNLTTHVWEYRSPEYDGPFRIDVYVKRQIVFYSIYEDDVLFDDFIGWVFLEKEIGYTVVVTEL